MTYIRLDDHFPQHRKILALDDAAFALHVRAICYSSTQLSDGEIPLGALPILTRHRKPQGLIAQLVEAELWEITLTGWQVHDYLDWQSSREEVLANKEIARRRSAMNANPQLTQAIRARDGNRCRYCGVDVNWRDRKSPAGGTYDHIVPICAGGDESLHNLVVSCRACNLHKGPRTLEESGMFLLDPGQKPARSRLDSSQIDLDTAVDVAVATSTATETEEPKAKPVQPHLSDGGSAPSPSEWPGHLQSVRLTLDEGQAPPMFYDVGFWERIDVAYAKHPDVFYVDELKNYLLWWWGQPPSRRRKVVTRSFTTWLRTEEAKSNRRRESSNGHYAQSGR